MRAGRGRLLAFGEKLRVVVVDDSASGVAE